MLEKYASHVEHDWDATPLHFASFYGDEVTIKECIHERANINHTDKYGRTPLHYASGMGHRKNNVIRPLVIMGADIDAQDNQGFTPLHYAIKYGKTEEVRSLIENGADVNIANKEGKTPFDYSKFATIDTQLIQAGATKDRTDAEVIQHCFDNKYPKESSDLVMSAHIEYQRDRLKEVLAQERPQEERRVSRRSI